MIDDVEVTRKIVRRHFREFDERLESDVAIAGAGPAGMVAARYLAEKGLKVTVFERKLSPGGGMWGGGIGYPVLVVQDESVQELRAVGVKTETSGDGYHTADSIECVSKLLAGAIDAGARVFNLMSVEDVLYRDERVGGFVINSSPIDIAGLHVDPVTVGARACIDATGHDAEVCRIVALKTGALETENGGIMGERSMWAERGEETVVENTGPVFPGLWVAGMCANAVLGAPRMGPIFGGMLLSGKKVAEQVHREL